MSDPRILTPEEEELLLAARALIKRLIQSEVGARQPDGVLHASLHSADVGLTLSVQRFSRRDGRPWSAERRASLEG